ncbi:hypothetical protein IH992_17565 [Candidatus Poribacteria bacterium]|nr:hypothetical protein [Candidatus Poribacteria bacterium]
MPRSPTSPALRRWGVGAVVSLDEENAKVKYDSQKARRAQLEAAIKEAGFTVK